MIIVQTGNNLDVVEEFVGDKIRVIGLRRHEGDEFIPLQDPRGLLAVLEVELNRTGQ